MGFVMLRYCLPSFWRLSILASKIHLSSIGLTMYRKNQTVVSPPSPTRENCEICGPHEMFRPFCLIPQNSLKFCGHLDSTLK